jgi:hypothetical protein
MPPPSLTCPHHARLLVLRTQPGCKGLTAQGGASPGHARATLLSCWSMLTRTQVARRIRRSIATVRRMEGQTLHPHVGARGEWLFKPEDVEAEAERIEASGRALQCDRALADITPRDHERAARSELTIVDLERRLTEALSRIAGLEDELADMQDAKKDWRARVEGACLALIESVGVIDDDVIDAFDVLACILDG